MQPDTPQRNDSGSIERYVPAIVLIAVGAVFFLNNLHIVPHIWSYWPIVLIIAGIFIIVDSSTDQGRITGAVVLVCGGILMASSLDLLPIRIRDLWPLILIGLGILMLVHRFPWTADYQGKPHPSWSIGVTGGHRMHGHGFGGVRDFAIFGGGKRKIISDNFERADFDAIFGGFEIDLRNAVMAGQSAVIEVNAVFGGAEIKIPVSWSAAVRGVGIFGGFSDSTTQPNPAMFPDPKILYVKGAAVFGGVNVKN